MTPEQRQESALRTTGCTTSTKNISTGLPEYFETQNTLKTLVPKSRLELTTEWALKPGGLQVPVSLATGKEAGMEARCMDTRPPPPGCQSCCCFHGNRRKGQAEQGVGVCFWGSLQGDSLPPQCPQLDWTHYLCSLTLIQASCMEGKHTGDDRMS